MVVELATRQSAIHGPTVKVESRSLPDCWLPFRQERHRELTCAGHICWDNAVTHTFFSTLKKELFRNLYRWPDVSTIDQNVFRASSRVGFTPCLGCGHPIAPAREGFQPLAIKDCKDASGVLDEIFFLKCARNDRNTRAPHA
jgi:hypothetical protein